MFLNEVFKIFLLLNIGSSIILCSNWQLLSKTCASNPTSLTRIVVEADYITCSH